MGDWTEKFGEFIEKLGERKEETRMIKDLAVGQIKKTMKIFFPSKLIGVKVMEEDEGEYGVYFIYPPHEASKVVSTEDVIFSHINQYDPDWVLWKDNADLWGATEHPRANNPEDENSIEHEFKTHNFYEALRALVDLFVDRHFEGLNDELQEYMSYD